MFRVRFTPRFRASFRRTVSALLLLMALAPAWPRASRAQDFAGGYTFSIPAADSSTQPFLPAFPVVPIAPDGFVGVDAGGHFSLAGAPVRFFGVNFAADAAFPNPARTPEVAAHLRKMGFNLVRMHHLDNPWSAYSLFADVPNTRQLNATMLSRMEYLIGAFKTNGVRVNMNLNVSRTFHTSDGVAGADSLPEFGKGVTYFDPQLVALQKEYATQLLTHVNPYTGLALVDDPVMALVEITNENSLYRAWRDGQLVPFAAGGTLMVRHAALLDSLWTVHLRRHHASTAALASAWSAGAFPADTSNRVSAGSFEGTPGADAWQLEQHAPAAATVVYDSVGAFAGKRSARLDVTPSGTDWHLQWKQVGVVIHADSVYQVRFAARANVPGPIAVELIQDSSPYTWYAGWTPVLTTQWQVFTYRLPATFTNTTDTRLAFALGAHGGSVWIDDVHVTREGRGGLPPGESLENATVHRPSFAECAGATVPRVRDVAGFYRALQDSFFATMRAHLVSTLHVRVPVVGTSLTAGLPDLASQSTMDVMDTHAYWDHPSFPGVPWSSTDWLIANQPMVRSGDGGAIGGLLTVAPMLGKPLTVSEYMHPFPNRYQSETLPFLTAYSLFHAADGVMLFDYNGSADDWGSDHVGSYFNVARNTALMSLVPAAARAFRDGLVAPSSAPVALDFTAADVESSPVGDGGGWSGPALVHATQGLVHAIRTRRYDGASATDRTALLAPASPPYVSDTGQITWDPAGSLRVGAPGFQVASGFFADAAGHAAGDLTVTASSRADFGVIEWVSLTGEPLARSRRSHLALSTRVRNAGMVWDGTNTIHDQWGTAPTFMEPASVTLRLHVHADSLRIHALDPSGAESGASWLALPADTNTFVLSLDQAVHATPWFGIEALGAGTAGVPGSLGGSVRDAVSPGAPSPFARSTTLRYRLGSGGRVQVDVFGVRGEHVATLADRVEPAGEHAIEWTPGRVAGGLYFARVRVLEPTGALRFERTVRLVRLR